MAKLVILIILMNLMILLSIGILGILVNMVFLVFLVIVVVWHRQICCYFQRKKQTWDWFILAEFLLFQLLQEQFQCQLVLKLRDESVLVV